MYDFDHLASSFSAILGHLILKLKKCGPTIDCILHNVFIVLFFLKIFGVKVGFDM
jgi:hypothetical protein